MTRVPHPYQSPRLQRTYRRAELGKAKAFCKEAKLRRLAGDVRGAARALGLAMVSRRVAILKFS